MRTIGGVRLQRRPGRQGRMQRRGVVLSAVAVLVLFAGYALLLGRGAAWLDGSTLHGLTATQRASEIDTMRGYLIQVGAGVLALGALLYTALNFQLAREGHVTDRYTKAIEQLGSDRLDVRLGAIYALERIMIDSARDHPTIVEVLAAFVREHATAPPPNPNPDSAPVKEKERPATDTQAAITVLGRRPAGRDERGGVNLSGAYLAGAHLAFADLNYADLADANLSGAELSGADLMYTNLSHANLSHAILIGARLTKTDLARANLLRANLTGALLADANLTGAALTGANLKFALLFNALLFNAILLRANLADANLRGAALTDADLTDADLTDADLADAKLTGSILTGVLWPGRPPSFVPDPPPASAEEGS